MTILPVVPVESAVGSEADSGPAGSENRPRPAMPRRRLSHWLGSQCLVCRHWQQAVVCAPCLAQHAAVRPRCATCAIEVVPGAMHCAACRLRPPPLCATVAALDYAHPWDTLITRFKFRDGVELSRPFSDLMGQRVADAFEAGLVRPDRVLPVPLTAGRLRERGYNQAWELARRLARRFDLAARTDGLERLIGGAHQADLHGDERRRQVRGAYALTAAGVAAVAGRHVALVDDVMTTGATLFELALTLQRGGAASVQAWVLARTPEG